MRTRNDCMTSPPFLHLPHLLHVHRLRSSCAQSLMHKVILIFSTLKHTLHTFTGSLGPYMDFYRCTHFFRQCSSFSHLCWPRNAGYSQLLLFFHIYSSPGLDLYTEQAETSILWKEKEFKECTYRYIYIYYLSNYSRLNILFRSRCAKDYKLTWNQLDDTFE